MLSTRARLLFMGLAVIADLSLWRAAAVEHEKQRLPVAHAKMQRAVQQLEDERAHITGELTAARQTIQEQTGDLTRLQTELQSAHIRLESSLTELASLQREHEQLRERDSSLETQLSAVVAEKQQLEAKLSSVKELRLAIHDLQRKVWKERWAAWQAHIQARRYAQREALAWGNRGYVVREGASTLGSSSPRMHVQVLEPQSQ